MHEDRSKQSVRRVQAARSWCSREATEKPSQNAEQARFYSKCNHYILSNSEFRGTKEANFCQCLPMRTNFFEFEWQFVVGANKWLGKPQRLPERKKRCIWWWYKINKCNLTLLDLIFTWCQVQTTGCWITDTRKHTERRFSRDVWLFTGKKMYSKQERPDV